MCHSPHETGIAPRTRAETLREPSRACGQALVEFALVLPVLLLLMVGAYRLGVVLLRVADAAYIAQSAATMAARYGGETYELRLAVQEAVRHSFLNGDAANFSWRVQTSAGPGSLLCASSGRSLEGGPGPGPQCECHWGEQITVITSYHWEVDALVWAWEGTVESPKTALCWRGTRNGGE